MSAGWGVLAPVDGLCHVFPVDDLQPHSFEHELTGGTLDLFCWCHPCLVGNSIVHHAVDLREEGETGVHVCTKPPATA